MAHEREPRSHRKVDLPLGPVDRGDHPDRGGDHGPAASAVDPTLQAAHALEAALTNLAEEIHALRAYSQRNRKMIWSLAGSVLFDVVLSVVLGIVAIQANHAASVAGENKRTLYATCLSGNESRELQRSLWGYALSTDLARSRVEEQRIKQLRAYVNDTFKPRDCARLR